MKKLYRVILLLFVSANVYGQSTVNAGNVTQLNRWYGGVTADSFFRIPLVNAHYPWFDSCGRLWFDKNVTHALYVNNCTGSQRLFSMADTALLRSIIGSNGGSADSSTFVTKYYGLTNYYPLTSNPLGYLLPSSITNFQSFSDTNTYDLTKAAARLIYMKFTDTVGLSNRINQKQAFNDTNTYDATKADLANSQLLNYKYSDSVGTSNRINQRIKYSDTLILVETPAQTNAKLSDYYLASNPNNYISSFTETDPIYSLNGQTKGDTSTYDATKANLNTTQALDVKYTDSVTKYVTPKAFHDTAMAIRSAIPTNNNALTNGAQYIKLNDLSAVSPATYSSGVIGVDTTAGNSHAATQAFVLNNSSSGGLAKNNATIDTVARIGNTTSRSADFGGIRIINTNSSGAAGGFEVWDATGNFFPIFCVGSSQFVTSGFFGTNFKPNGSGGLINIVNDNCVALQPNYPSSGDITFATDGAGAVGSSVTFPNKHFSVLMNGDVRVWGLGTGAVYTSGGVFTNTSPSDSTLKENIVNFRYGLDAIMQMRSVMYHYKGNPNRLRNFGWIAQEVRPYIPEIIDTFRQGYDSVNQKYIYKLGLDPMGMQAAMLNAIQELEEQILTLQGKLNDDEEIINGQKDK